MNYLQKEQIRKLRKEGLGYIKVAQALGISENTVKSYCRRNNLAGFMTSIVKSTQEQFCKECGKVVHNDKGHKSKSFCSETCRKEYWRQHQDKINRKTATTIICAVCHKKFSDYARNNRKYCSHACYIAGRYKGGKVNE